MNRMVSEKSVEWARWLVLLGLGGFFGNFILALCDHAQNGFFVQIEWITVQQVKPFVQYHFIQKIIEVITYRQTCNRDSRVSH
jgi:hypothetical protein